MNSSLSFAKIWFALSVLVLAFGYGFASHAWGLFPKTLMEQAWRQGYWRLQEQENENNPSLTDQIYDRSGWTSSFPERQSPGMTVITSSWKRSGKWKVGLKLFNEGGEVVHEWLVDREKVFGSSLVQRRDPKGTDIQGSLLLPNGDVVINLEYVGMARLNSCGKVLWTLTEGNHHSIARGSGSFWVPGVSQKKRSKSDQYPDGFPGLDGKKVWVDRILHVSEDGEILDDMNVLDIIYKNDLERYIPKALGGKRPTPKKITSDLTHINDVEPLTASMAEEYPLFEAGDLVVSLRSLSLVFVFDPDTKKVKWHSSDPFIYQHDPDFIGEGWIGVFDNNYDLTTYSSPDRGTMLGGSRVVYIKPHTDSTKVQFPTRHSEFLYTHVRGKWQGLNNGNMLLTESQAGRAVEVNSEGRTVWEWIHKPTDNSKVPSVTKATRHDLTMEEVASWSCSSVDSISTSTQKQQTAQ